MSEKIFILCQDDLGNYEIRYDDKIFHFLWEVAPILNEQQSTINKQKKRINELEQRDYDNQSERYKILGRAIELAANYIKDNDLEYCNFCGLVTDFENELLEGLNE